VGLEVSAPKGASLRLRLCLEVSRCSYAHTTRSLSLSLSLYAGALSLSLSLSLSLALQKIEAIAALISRQKKKDMTSSSAKYCAQHKEASHVHMNALTQTCVSPACARWASFGREGERKSRCAQHRLAGDIDLRNRRCQFRYIGADTDTPQQVCMKQPSYVYADVC
jgi:hypothetical protein